MSWKKFKEIARMFIVADGQVVIVPIDETPVVSLMATLKRKRKRLVIGCYKR